MVVDPTEFRRAMGLFATGVTIITTKLPDGRKAGLTANAFSSVSLSPPLVLVCVDKKSETYPGFGSSRAFAVNFLAAEQQDLSNRFAKSGGEKFDGVGFTTGSTGSPILEGTLGWVECRLHSDFEAGDHTVFLGEVVDLAMGSQENPLLYFRGGYRRLGA